MSILCQRSQPCLVPWLIEPHVPIPKSTPTKSNPFESFPQNHIQHPEYSRTKSENSNGTSSVWSFTEVQSLTSNSHNGKELSESNQIFVHPLAKRPASALSLKSLAMCTESLGSETGSEGSDEIPPASSTIESSHSLEKLKSRGMGFTGKLIPRRSFPPPLTTISGSDSDSVRMRPHREGGRLVIKAVTISSSNGYFEADRVDGRLRLFLVSKNYLVFDNEQVDESDTRGLGNYGNGGDDADGVDDDNRDEGADGMWVEGTRGHIGKGEGESGIGEDIQRPSRCREGAWWAWEENDVQMGAIS